MTRTPRKKSKSSKSEKSKSSDTTPKPPKRFRPETWVRIEILKQMKIDNQILWGKLPSGKTLTDRGKKWIELVNFVKGLCPTPKEFSKKQLLAFFRKAKKDFTLKAKNEKQTGKSPSKPWSDVDKLMFDIIGSNLSHQTKLKVRHLNSSNSILHDRLILFSRSILQILAYLNHCRLLVQVCNDLIPQYL